MKPTMFLPLVDFQDMPGHSIEGTVASQGLPSMPSRAPSRTGTRLVSSRPMLCPCRAVPVSATDSNGLITWMMSIVLPCQLMGHTPSCRDMLTVPSKAGNRMGQVVRDLFPNWGQFAYEASWKIRSTRTCSFCFRVSHQESLDQLILRMAEFGHQFVINWKNTYIYIYLSI